MIFDITIIDSHGIETTQRGNIELLSGSVHHVLFDPEGLSMEAMRQQKSQQYYQQRTDSRRLGKLFSASGTDGR